MDELETTQQAAIRETWEETGLTVKDCAFLYCTPCGIYDAYVYVARDWEGVPESRETPVRWCSVSTLTQPHNTFSDFNRDMFRRILGNL